MANSKSKCVNLLNVFPGIPATKYRKHLLAAFRISNVRENERELVVMLKVSVWYRYILIPVGIERYRYLNGIGKASIPS